MKKLTLILTIFISIFTYAQEVAVTHDVITIGTEKGHKFEVTDESYLPYYDPETESDGYSYTWHTDEGHISNEESPVFFFDNSGEHTMHLMLTPRKKGDEDLKVYSTFVFNVTPSQISSLSNGSIIGEDMYLDGQARSGDKIYVVVPLNSCMSLGVFHDYKVGYDNSKLEFSSLLTQSNLYLGEVSTFMDEALGMTLNKVVDFSYDWDTYRNDVAAVLEFDVLSDIEEPVVLKFHKASAAQCDNNTAMEFTPIRGPYDPNYKESDISEINVFENPSQKTNPTEVMYTIHFQNIGDAPVDSVTIVDVLPLHLTFLSFEGSSEPSALVDTSSYGDTLRWIIAPNADIKGTNETPTQPEPSTKGWVRFKAKIAKENSIIYDTCHCLANRATIFFDSLSPIITDADVIVIGDSLCFSTNSFGSSYSDNFCDYITNDSSSSSYRKMKPVLIEKETPFIAYPNPFENSFQLKGDLDNIKALDVFNSIGQKIVSLPKYNNAISLDGYPDGLYFIRIITGNEQQVLRLKKH